MDRKRVTKCKMTDPGDNGFVPGTPAYRIGLVWPLTLEAVSLGKRYDAQQRLQRHVVRLVRRGR